MKNIHNLYKSDVKKMIAAESRYEAPRIAECLLASDSESEVGTNDIGKMLESLQDVCDEMKTVVMFRSGNIERWAVPGCDVRFSRNEMIDKDPLAVERIAIFLKDDSLRESMLAGFGPGAMLPGGKYYW